MKFCDKCDNMLYISLRPDEAREGAPLELTYSCKHCGFATTAQAESEAAAARAGGDPAASAAGAVLSTDYADDQTSYKQYATPYLRFDPTLPRSSDIECIRGEECSRPKEALREVIYVKYDPVKLKYLYHCVHCSTFWKSGGGVVAV